jgi:peroxiredoxin/signal transduction histidine kinase
MRVPSFFTRAYQRSVAPYFPAVGYVSLFGLAGFSVFKAYSAPQAWFGALVATVPFALQMARIQAIGGVINRSRAGFLTLAAVGVPYSIAFAPRLALIVSVAGLLIAWLDTYGHNVVDRDPDKGIAVGEKFPDLSLKDHLGEMQDFRELLRTPSVILFIRGSWCPFCMVQVNQIAGMYRDFDARGIRVIVVSSQVQEATLQLAEKHKVPITFLVDETLQLGRMLEIVHKKGVPLGAKGSPNQKDTFFPTAIITNEEGKIVFVDKTDDITVRPEPETFLKVIEENRINVELERRVQKRTSEIRDLLDNIGEGFFSFGPDFVIHREMSAATEKFFPTDIRFQDPFLVLKAKDPTETKSLLGLVFSGQTEFQMIEELLPQELAVGERTFGISYRWVKSPRATTESKIIAVMKDISREKLLAQMHAREEELNAMIVRVAVDREGFLQLLSETQRMFDEIQVALQPFDVAALFRHFHTIKGGMAVYGLARVARAAHAIEAKLTGATETIAPEIARDFAELRKTLDGQLDELKALVNRDELGAKDRVFKITQSQISQLADELLHSVPADAWKEIQAKVERLKLQPIQAPIKRLVTLAEELAPRLGKAVQVELKGQELPVKHDKLEPLFGVLVHLIRNSLDHGLETPEDRVARGKSEEGKLSIIASQDQSSLKLVIMDDGAGINVPKVKEIAVAKGLLTPDKAAALSDRDAAHLIFAPGFSTKTEVTDVSGRGVGMDAVKDAVTRLGGRIRIATRPGVGTAFEIVIPEAA